MINIDEITKQKFEVCNRNGNFFGVSTILNSNPDTEEEVQLCGGICQDDELYDNCEDAQEVDVLLQPYKSQHPSPTDIGCHLEVHQEDAKYSYFAQHIL